MLAELLHEHQRLCGDDVLLLVAEDQNDPDQVSGNDCQRVGAHMLGLIDRLKLVELLQLVSHRLVLVGIRREAGHVVKYSVNRLCQARWVLLLARKHGFLSVEGLSL